MLILSSVATSNLNLPPASVEEPSVPFNIKEPLLSSSKSNAPYSEIKISEGLTIGCKVNSLEDIPEGMDGLELPTQNYTLFTAQGKIPNAIIDTWQKIWDSKIGRTYTFDFERYDERSHNPDDAIIDIYIATK